MYRSNKKSQGSSHANSQQKRRDGWWRTRIGALNKVFGGPRRYGDGKLYQFSDDDGGREDLRILLDHYAYSNPAAMLRIIKARAPWIGDAERESLMEQVGRFSRCWKSPALAEALRLTEAERIELGGVRTIGAIDVTPEERKQTRLQRSAERRRQKRRAAKVKPRAEYEATSLSRTKPWDREGVSRATWYRQRRETSMDAIKLVNAASTHVSKLARSRRSVGAAASELVLVSALKGRPSPACDRRKVSTATESMRRAA